VPAPHNRLDLSSVNAITLIQQRSRRHCRGFTPCARHIQCSKTIPEGAFMLGMVVFFLSLIELSFRREYDLSLASLSRGYPKPTKSKAAKPPATSEQPKKARHPKKPRAEGEGHWQPKSPPPPNMFEARTGPDENDPFTSRYVQRATGYKRLPPLPDKKSKVDPFSSLFVRRATGWKRPPKADFHTHAPALFSSGLNHSCRDSQRRDVFFVERLRSSLGHPHLLPFGNQMSR
jgi:hypothetical protein